MIAIAKNLVRTSNFSFVKMMSINMGIRYTKPVIPKLVTDNPSKQEQMDYELLKYLQEEDRLGPCTEYDQIIPGVFRTYPCLFEEDTDYLLRSKRHRVAKLKRAKRRDGKKTHIQNN